jgi:PAS domain S-box-containing protein
MPLTVLTSPWGSEGMSLLRPSNSAVSDTDQLLRSFVNDAPLFFIAVRQDGTIAYASAAVERLLGRIPSELLGTSVLEFVHPDEVERAIVHMSATATTGMAPGIARFRVQHADGSWKVVELFGSGIGDGTEYFVGIYGRDGQNQIFLEDVLTLLLSSGSRTDALRLVLNAVQWHGVGSHVAINFWDGHQSVHISTGVPAELGGGEDAGSPWDRCRSTRATVEGGPDQLDPSRRLQAQTLGIGSFWIEPVVWSAELPPATITIWTAVDKPFGPTIHSAGMDVARYLSQLILRWTRQTQELERATKQLVAQEKLASLGTLTAGVAHEIRNPLSFVKNFAEGGTERAAELKVALSGHAPDPGTALAVAAELEEALVMIAKHAQRIDTIVGNMLGYSREQAGPPLPTDIGALVATFVDLGYQGYRGSGHPEFRAHLTVDAPEDITAVVRPQEIGRVVVNLVSNACDAMDALGGQGIDRSPDLVVEVRRTKGRVQISITDNGIGIPSERLDHIFEPFWTTKAPGEGTGLGLSLCNDIVVGLHGGELLVDSDPGRCTVFTIDLPLGIADEAGHREQACQET